MFYYINKGDLKYESKWEILAEVCFIDFMKDMPYREDENGNEDPYTTILIAPAVGEDNFEGNTISDFYRAVSYKDIDIDIYKNEFEELY